MFQRSFNALVAVEANEFYVLDYVFDNVKGRYGAVGTIMRPVWKDEYEERTSIEGMMERYEELWRHDVSCWGGTTDSLEEWVTNISRYEHEEDQFDVSHEHLWDQFRIILGDDEDSVPVFEAVGHGRCLDRIVGMTEHNIDHEIGDQIVNEGLLNLVNMYEAVSKTP